VETVQDGDDEQASTNQVDEDAPTMEVDFENHPDQGIVSVEKDSPMSKDLDEMYRIQVRAGTYLSPKYRRWQEEEKSLQDSQTAPRQCALRTNTARQQESHGAPRHRERTSTL
jgi:hypothetical protein